MAVGLAIAGIVVAVIAPWSSPRAAATSYRLPPSQSSDLGLGTTTTGFAPFEARLFGTTACAWVGASDRPPTTFTWPAAWRVRLHPAELVDATGRVLAREGVEAGIVGDMQGAKTGPCASSEPFSSSVEAVRYELWSDGWTPSQPAMMAAFEGTFQAAVTASGACAWLGGAGSIEPFQWPANWTVQFTPKAELFDPNGKLLAVEGQRIRVPGGQVTSDRPGTGTRCGSGTHGTVYAVNGPPGG